MLLILDLDETLIHATQRPLARPADLQVDRYHVYKRHGVDRFLHSCAERFTLAVWSSATSDYVHCVLAQLAPEIEFEFVWGRDRCVRRYDPEYQDFYYVKDLKKVKRLGFDLAQVLIVDDTPQKVERNYGNAIYITPYLGDLADQELELLLSYLRKQFPCDDVRRLEKRNWRTIAGS